ncbi:hypothetical protein BST61_g6773 [Cercospora zeina]
MNTFNMPRSNHGRWPLTSGKSQGGTENAAACHPHRSDWSELSNAQVWEKVCVSVALILPNTSRRVSNGIPEQTVATISMRAHISSRGISRHIHEVKHNQTCYCSTHQKDAFHKRQRQLPRLAHDSH